MRLIVYSHDAFGLGNIRRMLAICQHLLTTIPELSILVLSGSPAIQKFSIPERLDYIKLPCLSRDRNGKLAAKYLTSDVDETIRLRSNLIETAIVDFKPDLLLIDKKPYGLLGELKPALNYLKVYSPQTKIVLLLRDILDKPKKTVKEWQYHGYYQAIQHYYDRVLIVGTEDIFDTAKEYQFPPIVSEKTRYCGYIRKDFSLIAPQLIKQQLGINKNEKFIVVTPGGGEDGEHLINSYLSCLERLDKSQKLKSLIVFGSEMSQELRDTLMAKIANNPNILTLNFTDNLMSYMNAADAIISMAGYNTVTEILSLNKKAIAIPRCQPSQEQLIRVARLSKFNLLRGIHPEAVTTDKLYQSIVEQLKDNNISENEYNLDFNGLDYISEEICSLLPIPDFVNYPVAI